MFVAGLREESGCPLPSPEAPLNPLRLLPLLATVLLSGCFESASSASPEVSSGFVPSPSFQFDSKIVLRSEPGRFGPMFLETYWLDMKVSSGSRTQIGGNFPFGAVDASTPWIDSDLWIDYRVGTPTIEFWNLDAVSDGVASPMPGILQLEECGTVPPTVFKAAKDSGVNPIEHQRILRVGRYAFLLAQNFAGYKTISRPGIALVKMGSSMTTANGCTGFDQAGSAFGVKWLDLHPYESGLGDSGSYRGKFLAATESDSGIFLSYWTQGDSATPDRFRMYLAFVDTAGRSRILDSSTTSFYAALFRQGNRIWAVDDGSRVYNIPEAGGRPLPRSGTWSLSIAAQCNIVQGRCVLSSMDRLYSLDTSNFVLQPLSNTGLAGNTITGVVQSKDTVYVSTLSGVFTKPVSRFFDPAK